MFSLLPVPFYRSVTTATTVYTLPVLHDTEQVERYRRLTLVGCFRHPALIFAQPSVLPCELFTYADQQVFSLPATQPCSCNYVNSVGGRRRRFPGRAMQWQTPWSNRLMMRLDSKEWSTDKWPDSTTAEDIDRETVDCSLLRPGSHVGGGNVPHVLHYRRSSGCEGKMGEVSTLPSEHSPKVSDTGMSVGSETKPIPSFVHYPGEVQTRTSLALPSFLGKCGFPPGWGACTVFWRGATAGRSRYHAEFLLP